MVEGKVCVLKGIQASSSTLMLDIQKQLDLAFTELDVVEEMLRPLVDAQKIHHLSDCFRIPITQTKEFQLLGRLLEQRVNQLRKKILSLIGPEAYQHNYLDSAMLMTVHQNL